MKIKAKFTLEDYKYAGEKEFESAEELNEYINEAMKGKYLGYTMLVETVIEDSVIIMKAKGKLDKTECTEE